MVSDFAASFPQHQEPALVVGPSAVIGRAKHRSAQPVLGHLDPVPHHFVAPDERL